MLGVLSAMLCCGAVSAQQHEVEMILSEIWINGLTAKSRNPVLLAVPRRMCMPSALLLLSPKPRHTRIWEVRRGRHPM